LALDPVGVSQLNIINVPVARKDNPRPSPPPVDKKAEEATNPAILLKSGSEQVFQQADAFRQGDTIKLATGLKQQVAIEAYQAVAKDQQRQDIQQLLGVDTFI